MKFEPSGISGKAKKTLHELMLSLAMLLGLLVGRKEDLIFDLFLRFY